MHCGKKSWIREFVAPSIFPWNPDYVAARSLQSLRSSKWLPPPPPPTGWKTRCRLWVLLLTQARLITLSLICIIFQISYSASFNNYKFLVIHLLLLIVLITLDLVLAEQQRMVNTITTGLFCIWILDIINDKEQFEFWTVRYISFKTFKLHLEFNLLNLVTHPLLNIVSTHASQIILWT